MSSDDATREREPYRGLDFRDFIHNNRNLIRLFALLVLATIAFGERINLWPSPIDFLTAVGHHRQGRYDEAAQRFRALAEEGHVRAKYNLAIMLIDGVGVEQDRQAARHLLFEAARRGHDESRRLFFTHFALYENNLRGITFEFMLENVPGASKVLNYYIQNFAPASIYRGLWKDAGFLHGIGSLIKPRKRPRFGSIPLIHKSRHETLLQEAEAGNAEAMFELGVRHLAVMGLPHDEARAVDLFLEAERLDHDGAHAALNAMARLEPYATRYAAQLETRHNKRNRLFELNPQYLLRAREGDAESQIYIALMFSQGYGYVAENKASALKYLRQSIRDLETRGHGPLVDAVLTHIHREQTELETLAAAGDPVAQYLLAARLASEADADDLAFEWLARAAKHDEGNFYYALGVFTAIWPYVSEADYALMQRLRKTVARGDKASYERLFVICRRFYSSTSILRYACMNVDGFGNPCAQPWAARSRE